MQKKALIVVGSHRSGTSAIARVCSLLGAALPTKLLTAQPDNMLGYWEPADLVAANNDILATIQSSWDDVRPVSQEWFSSDIAAGWVVRLRQVIEVNYTDQDLFVIKDPRLSRLLPVLLATLTAMSIRPHVIIAIRHPIDVASSLHARNHFSKLYSLLLWLTHMLAAEANSRTVSRSFVSYDAILRDWRREFARVGKELGIEWPVGFAKAAPEISDFLRTAARHHKFELGDAGEGMEMPAFVSDLFEALHDASVGNFVHLELACEQANQASAQWISLLDPFLHLLRRPNDVRLKSESDTQIAEIGRQMATVTEVEATRYNELLQAQRQLQENLSSSISQLEQSVAHREYQIAELTTQIAEANERVANSRKDIADRDRQIQSLTGEAAELSERIAGIEHEISSRDRHVQALAQEADEANERLRQTKHELTARNELIGRLTEEAQRAATRLARGEEEITARDTRFHSLVKQVEIASEWLSRADQEIATRAALVEAISRERTATAESLAQAQQELAARDQELQRLGDEAATSALVLEDAREELSKLEIGFAKERSEAAERLAQAQQEATARDQELQRLLDEAAASAALMTRLKQEAAEANDQLARAQQGAAALADQFSCAQSEISARDSEIEKLIQDSAVVHDNIARAGREIEARDEQMQLMAEEIAEARERLDRAERAYDAHRKQLEASIAGAEAGMRAYEQNIQSLVAEHAKTVDRAATAERELEQRESQITTLIEDLTARDGQIVALSQQLTQVEAQLNTTSLEMSQQGRHVEALSAAYDALSANKQKFEQTSRELESSLAELERLYKSEHQTVEQFRTGIEALLRRMQPQPAFWQQFRDRLKRRSHDPDQRRTSADYKLISQSGQFDAAYYLANSPDLLIGDIDPLMHFILFGAKEGRNPSRRFNTRWYLDTHSDLNEWKRNPLSHYILHGAREGRLPASPAMAQDATVEGFAPSLPVGAKPYKELRVSLEYPEVGLVRPYREPNFESLTIHWVIPDFRPGAGGHMTIFRIVKLLAQFGHRQTLWIQNPSEHSTPKSAHQTMEKHFLTADVEFRFLPSDISTIEGDAIIATDRWTVFPVVATKNFFRRFYFVQDYETHFYPAGSHALLTDFTYSLGLDCLCAGRWLNRLMGEHGAWTMAWELATDDATYFPPLSEQHRDTSRIAYYSRITSSRRAVELGLLALEELARWGYKFAVDFYGASAEFHEPPYPHQYHGILSPMELGNLYRKSALGLVFSSTNYSLVPHEMMACRLPVVELDVESVRSVFPEDVLVRVAPHPIAIAEGIANLLDNKAARSQLSDRALKYQEQFSWEKSARLIESALRERIAAAASGKLDNSRQFRGSPYRACTPSAARQSDLAFDA